MTSVLEEHRLRIFDGLEDNIDLEIKAAVRERMSEIRSDIVALERDGEQKRFVHSRIEREVDRFPEERDELLCTCRDDYCDLKEGRLPFEVRQADTIHEGIREFRKQHAGQPKVLDDALTAWNEREAHVVDTLQLLHIALSSNRHPDDVEQALQYAGTSSKSESDVSAEHAPAGGGAEGVVHE